MAGLYPTNKTVQLNGQKTLYPGVDATGKYTSGDFNDPLAPPSRLDAETVNLVIDNLNSLIESMGSDANNTNTEQLATLFSSAAIANKGIKRDSAGRAKVTAPRATDDIARKAEVDAEANTRTSATTALSTRIASNDTDIANLSSRISSNDTDISSLSSRISSNDTDISSLSSSTSSLSSRISSNDTDISNLSSRISSNYSSNYSRISSLQNYRSYETNTGKTWINGKTIYRRSWEGTIDSNQTLFNIGTNRTPISMRLLCRDNSFDWNQNFGSDQTSYQMLKYKDSSGNVFFILGGGFVNKTNIAVIEYYK